MRLTKGDLRRLVDDADWMPGKIVTIFIQVLIVISVVSFSLETLPNLPSSSREFLNLVEAITVIIFTIEYLLRLYLEKKKKDYFFSFFGVIDLAAIVPFYIASGIDLRAIRVFRMLRLVRILKLVKYSQAIQRFYRALRIVKEELILFGFVSGFVLFLSAMGIYYFESQAQPEQFKSVFHSLWWAVTTLTTVGYGDMYPVTIGGKIFTFFVLMIGLGVVAVPTGLIASALTQTRNEEKNMM